MESTVFRVVIAGGGTAGWLSAARLAAWSRVEGNPPLDITLVESPDIPTIGVGEGTWPTIRETLSAIGIGEEEFLIACDASFKQGSRFDGWLTGQAGDQYYHPFSPVPELDPAALVSAWQGAAAQRPFGEVLSPQPAITAADLAPRQSSMPPYSGALNYAYHLDAGKLVALLRRHSVERLGIKHVQDTIRSVIADNAVNIAALVTAAHGRIEGDLFIDCTGFKALLIDGHCKSLWVDQSRFVMNDRALAAQVLVMPGSPIASVTVGTAHQAGWLWDIGLPTRRGIGCVYSSRFIDDDGARAILDRYIGERLPQGSDYAVRAIAFPTGHREQFWVGNCVAIGLSAGFIEPLEASAIVLIELSLKALISAFPSDRAQMPFLAERFNWLFTQRWQRIVEFLKLHYVLSTRDEPYWRAQREPATIPDRLAGLLRLWRDQPPASGDLPLAEEMFPAASFQYIYYGMGGTVPVRLPPISPLANEQLANIADRARALASVLPTNRSYLDSLARRSAQAVQESAA